MLQAGLHQPGHVPDALVTILGIAGDGGHVHLRNTGLPQRGAHVNGILVLPGDLLHLGLGFRRDIEASQGKEPFGQDHFWVLPLLQQELDAWHALLDRVGMQVDDDGVSAELLGHLRQGEGADRTGKLGDLDQRRLALEAAPQRIQLLSDRGGLLADQFPGAVFQTHRRTPPP